jgi:ribonucleoside-diphosphate reductase alpha chain
VRGAAKGPAAAPSNGTAHTGSNGAGSPHGANGNGSNGTNGSGGNGHAATAVKKAVAAVAASPRSAPVGDLQAAFAARHDQFASFQADAPACDRCGAITARAGNCYLCYNCGNSMGCS